MKTFKTIGITAVIMAVITAALIKLYWPTVEIRIEKPKVDDTVHTEPTDLNPENKQDCELAIRCKNSDINVDLKAEGNKVLGKAYDDCKYADFEFIVKARSVDKHIFQFGFGWTVEKGYYLRPGYLYRTPLWDIAIGGSAVLRKVDPGAEIMIQKSF